MRRSDKQTALDAFIARKAEIDTMLERIKALSDEHFDVSPDDINWGHVGALAHYAELLKRITDAAFKEGEHAA
jgi:chaperonin cofactor prefoldin